MKIMFANRFNYETRKGGDTYQMLYTKEYLEKQYPDLEIVVITSPKEISGHLDCRIIHIFNMQFYSETLAYVDEAKKLGLKVVLSPIYWQKTDAIFIARMVKFTCNPKIIEMLSPFKHILSFHKETKRYLSKTYRTKYNDLLNKVDVLVPNSDEELSIIKSEFDIGSDVKCLSVPNAIILKRFPQEISNPTNISFSKYHGCVLEVARIEAVKNQIAVVKACYNMDVPIVFVGSDNNTSSKYSRKLHRIAEKRGNVHFVGEVSQDETAEFYKLASVHILPSFRESPGLVTLEALFNGCKIVTASSDFCPVAFYKLDEYAYICNPYSTKSIRRAIGMALDGASQKQSPSDAYFYYISYKNVANIMNKIYRGL